MKKIISFVGLFAVLGVGIGDAHGVAMSAQVRRLLQEKQEKIEQLEKCEGKKQGWMIAGISTIGLTAVGVGVNIAQASKSNRLSDEIEMEKSALEKQQNELNRIQNDIAKEQAKKAEEERKRAEEEERRRNATNGNDGAIGEKCNDDKGVWLIANEGNDKKCSNSAGEIVDCKCVENVTPTPGQGSGGGDKPVEKPKASETNGRVVGGACIDEDIRKLSPYGWVSGTYIQVTEKANSSTVLKARCETKSGAGKAVPCNCKAEVCDSSKNFELGSNGLCVKKKVELNAEEERTGYGYYDIDGDHKDFSDCSVSTAGEWCVVFPKYTVKGKAVCNSTTGTYAVAISSEQHQSGGKECWCKMTSPKESSWVFWDTYGDSAGCAADCAFTCAFIVSGDSVFRGAVFGSVK